MPQTYRVTTDQGTYNVTVDGGSGVPPGDTMKARMSPHDISDAPDGPPSRLDNVNAALEPLAHPQTAGDFGNLLIPSGGAAAVGKVLAPVGEAISKYGGAAAKVVGGAASAMLPPSMVTPIRGALKVLGELKPSEWNSPLTVAGREGRAHAAVADMVDRYKPNTGGLPASETVAPSSGRVPYAPPSSTAAPEAAAASGTLSDAERASLAKKYPGLDPAKVEQQLSGRVQMAPTDRPPITVSPESPMQAPRVTVGAEVVGRQNGMTTQAVRDATGPIRGEAPGTAAGMPSQPKDRIVQKLIDMGPKGQGLPESAREAYAASGTSDKTRLQVQAYLDALRNVGFVGAGAAGADAIRRAVMDRLGGTEQ